MPTIAAAKNLVKWNSISAAVDLSGFKLPRQRVVFKQNFNLHVHELFLVTCWKIAIWAWFARHLHRAGAGPGSLLMPGNMELSAHTWTKYSSLGLALWAGEMLSVSLVPPLKQISREWPEFRVQTPHWGVSHQERVVVCCWSRLTAKCCPPRAGEHHAAWLRGTAESQPPVASPVMGTG